MGHHLGGSCGSNRYARFCGRGFAETNADHSGNGGTHAVNDGGIITNVLGDNPTGGTFS